MKAQNSTKSDIYRKPLQIMGIIHMKQRMMGVTFAIKNREAKDRYVDSQFKNALDELLADTANNGLTLFSASWSRRTLRLK